MNSLTPKSLSPICFLCFVYVSNVLQMILKLCFMRLTLLMARGHGKLKGSSLPQTSIDRCSFIFCSNSTCNLTHIYFEPRNFAEKDLLKLDKPFPSPYLTKWSKTAQKHCFLFKLNMMLAFFPKWSYVCTASEVQVWAEFESVFSSFMFASFPLLPSSSSFLSPFSLLLGNCY